MGITRTVKSTALAITILLLGLAAAACGGNDSSSGSFEDMVPQRANIVGSVDVDQFVDVINMDLEQLFELMASDTLDGPEGINEFFDIDPARIVELFGEVNRADIFAEAEADGNSEYFGVVLHGTFDENAVIALLQVASDGDLVQEDFMGTDVYTLPDDSDEITLSFLDSETLAIGSSGAVKDMIDLRGGDAESASGPMIEVFEDLRQGVFGFAAEVPQDAFAGEDLGSVPGLGDLPISLDFLSSLEIVGLGGKLNNDSLDLLISMDFTNDDAAETLEGFINGIVTLASGFSPDPRTTELLSSLEIDQDGRRLTITIEIPESELSDIVGDLTSTPVINPTVTPTLPPTPDIRNLQSRFGEEIVIMPSARHVEEGQAVEYSTIPPTSGLHWARWADCGWYPDGLPDEVTTHNLEHGNIVVSYNFPNPARVSELRRVLDNVDEFRSWGVARSYDKIPDGQLSLAAWGRLATFEGVSAREIEPFFEVFAGMVGPETVPC
ncbi:MAG: hypothetical protein BZY87_07080 [SAR202 cluster bacterium Io17-Chloro-G6]|nr:MAG: hypothetical protein BZY87_07080 [SAR202 cluster bacterium Io17-Chloro-G6]